MSSNDLPTNKDDETLEGETDSLVGITFKTNHDLFSFNVGYLQAKSELKNTDPKEVDFKMFAFEGEVYINDATFKAGYINAQLSDIFSDELRYYLSLEYAYKDFTPYIYYASESLYFKDNLSTPPGRSSITQNIKEKHSMGIRYDFYDNLALKLSYTKSENEFNYSDDSSEVEDTDKYKAVLNVIF